MSISFPKYGFTTYTETDPPKRYLTETGTRSFSGGNPESGPRGYENGTSTATIDPRTGEMSGTRGGGGDPDSPTSKSGETTVSSYDDPPNQETDNEATVSFTATLSRENTTAMMVSNGMRELEDFTGEFEEGSVQAHRYITETETTFQYQKVRFKFVWEEGLLEEQKHPVHYLLVFEPEDDPDTEADESREQLEILDTPEIRWDGKGAESKVFTLDPRRLKGEKEGRYFLMKVGMIPDYNRDGTIDDFDRGRVTKSNPWRWWVNDDNDEGEIGAIDVSGGIFVPDRSSPYVDGMRDLVDFFPLKLELGPLLEKFPSDEFEYVLENQEKTFKFIETAMTTGESSSYIRDLSTARSFGDMTDELKTSGNPLSQEFLDNLTETSGVILVEGILKSKSPILLKIRKPSSSVIFEIEFPLMLSAVEEMYRHVDLRPVTRNLDGSSAGGHPSSLPTRKGDPGDPYPDALTNGKYFAFIHGFNVTGSAARGWNAEIFKRLHHQGSNARFIGISWHGDTSPNYHKAVFHAFQTGEKVAEALSFANTDLTIAAHSLGNVVISHAISEGGFAPARYYMINAASPIEAYQTQSVTGNQQYAMTVRSWKPYAGMQRLFAARWHELFDRNDARSELAWDDVFQTSVDFFDVYNFYSSGEDVVQNPEVDTANLITNGFEVVRGAWANQEFAKGTEWVPAQLQEPRQAGWGFNRRYISTTPFNLYDLPTPEEASAFSDEQLRTDPLFYEFLNEDLLDSQLGNTVAGHRLSRYHLLAGAIPALSYAAAANPVVGVQGNFNMQDQFRTEGEWPQQGHEGRNAGSWLHSDFYHVALSYVYLMYDQMIETGDLASEP